MRPARGVFGEVDVALFNFFRRKPKSVLDVLNGMEELQKAKSVFQAVDTMGADGLDVDRVPGGTGDFGLSVNNPVPCRSIAGSNRYLASLRAPDGTKVRWERTRSLFMQDTPGPVDEYAITHVSGEGLPPVYLSGYYKRNSTHAPVGYILVDPPLGMAPPERIREESLRVAFRSLFPIFSNNQKFVLEFVDLFVMTPHADAFPCAATFRTISFDVDPETGQRVTVDEIFEQDVYIFPAPLPQGPSVLSENVFNEIRFRQFLAAELLNEANEVMAPQDLFPFQDFDYTDFWVPIAE